MDLNSTKRTQRYNKNKRLLARDANLVWPERGITMISAAHNHTLIIATYIVGGRRMVKYETTFNNHMGKIRTTQNETTMDNLLHGREFIRVLR